MEMLGGGDETTDSCGFTEARVNRGELVEPCDHLLLPIYLVLSIC
jgi:hypothetical protein